MAFEDRSHRRAPLQKAPLENSKAAKPQVKFSYELGSISDKNSHNGDEHSAFESKAVAREGHRCLTLRKLSASPALRAPTDAGSSGQLPPVVCQPDSVAAATRRGTAHGDGHSGFRRSQCSSQPPKRLMRQSLLVAGSAVGSSAQLADGTAGKPNSTSTRTACTPPTDQRRPTGAVSRSPFDPVSPQAPLRGFAPGAAPVCLQRAVLAPLRCRTNDEVGHSKRQAPQTGPGFLSDPLNLPVVDRPKFQPRQLLSMDSYSAARAEHGSSLQHARREDSPWLPVVDRPVFEPRLNETIPALQDASRTPRNVVENIGLMPTATKLAFDPHVQVVQGPDWPDPQRTDRFEAMELQKLRRPSLLIPDLPHSSLEPVVSFNHSTRGLSGKSTAELGQERASWPKVPASSADVGLVAGLPEEGELTPRQSTAAASEASVGCYSERPSAIPASEAAEASYDYHFEPSMPHNRAGKAFPKQHVDSIHNHHRSDRAGIEDDPRFAEAGSASGRQSAAQSPRRMRKSKRPPPSAPRSRVKKCVCKHCVARGRARLDAVKGDVCLHEYVVEEGELTPRPSTAADSEASVSCRSERPSANPAPEASGVSYDCHFEPSMPYNRAGKASLKQHVEFIQHHHRSDQAGIEADPRFAEAGSVSGRKSAAQSPRRMRKNKRPPPSAPRSRVKKCVCKHCVARGRAKSDEVKGDVCLHEYVVEELDDLTPRPSTAAASEASVGCHSERPSVIAASEASETSYGCHFEPSIPHNRAVKDLRNQHVDLTRSHHRSDYAGIGGDPPVVEAESVHGQPRAAEAPRRARKTKRPPPPAPRSRVNKCVCKHCLARGSERFDAAKGDVCLHEYLTEDVSKSPHSVEGSQDDEYDDSTSAISDCSNASRAVGNQAIGDLLWQGVASNLQDAPADVASTFSQVIGFLKRKSAEEDTSARHCSTVEVDERTSNVGSRRPTCSGTDEACQPTCILPKPQCAWGDPDQVVIGSPMGTNVSVALYDDPRDISERMFHADHAGHLDELARSDAATAAATALILDLDAAAQVAAGYSSEEKAPLAQFAAASTTAARSQPHMDGSRSVHARVEADEDTMLMLSLPSTPILTPFASPKRSQSASFVLEPDDLVVYKQEEQSLRPCLEPKAFTKQEEALADVITSTASLMGSTTAASQSCSPDTYRARIESLVQSQGSTPGVVLEDCAQDPGHTSPRPPTAGAEQDTRFEILESMIEDLQTGMSEVPEAVVGVGDASGREDTLQFPDPSEGIGTLTVGRSLPQDSPLQSPSRSSRRQCPPCPAPRSRVKHCVCKQCSARDARQLFVADQLNTDPTCLHGHLCQGGEDWVQSPSEMLPVVAEDHNQMLPTMESQEHQKLSCEESSVQSPSPASCRPCPPCPAPRSRVKRCVCKHCLAKGARQQYAVDQLNADPLCQHEYVYEDADKVAQSSDELLVVVAEDHLITPALASHDHRKVSFEDAADGALRGDRSKNGEIQHLGHAPGAKELPSFQAEQTISYDWPVSPVCARPSVGTWLAARPPSRGIVSRNQDFDERAEAELRPESSTARSVPSAQEPDATGFLSTRTRHQSGTLFARWHVLPSIGSWHNLRHGSDWHGVAVTVVAGQVAEQAHVPKDCDAIESQWEMQPSVGSWLRRPAPWIGARQAFGELSPSSPQGYSAQSQTHACRLRACALHFAARDGDVDAVNRLLGARIDPAAKDAYGITALHLAADVGAEDVVRALLAAGANPNAETLGRAKHSSGVVPLHAAARCGCANIVTLLLDARASPDRPRGDGVVPLHFAVQGGFERVVKTLLSAEAAPQAKALDNFTPLHDAACGGYDEIVSMLLGARASPHVTAKDGVTPLHSAARGGHDDVVSVLLNDGASPHAASFGNFTALHDAAHAGHPGVIQQLLRASAAVDVVSVGGATALHLAAQAGHAHIASALVEAGASLRISTDKGVTSALRLAAKRGHHHVVQALQDSRRQCSRADSPRCPSTPFAKQRRKLVSARSEGSLLGDDLRSRDGAEQIRNSSSTRRDRPRRPRSRPHAESFTSP